MKKLAVSFLLMFSPVIFAATVPVILQDTPLRDFVVWYSKETGNSVLISPDVSLSLTVYAPSVERQALPDFFSAVIRSHGLELSSGSTGEPAVISSPKKLPEVEQLISTDSTRSTQLHVFKHVLVDDLLDFSSSFFSSTSAPSPTPSAALPLSSSVFVIRSQNALAVTATEEKHTLFQELLPFLDSARPLVYLEAVIYEVASSENLDLGVSYASSRSENTPYTAGFNRGLRALANSGFSFGIYDGDFLNFALNALHANTDTKILSTPKILVMSGESGTISVGQNVPFIASSSTVNNQLIQSIERRDVGFNLSVKPFVSSSGQIILGLSLSADSINTSVQASDIITNTRNLSTRIQLASGESLVLGGLVNEDTDTRVSQVPILGSIPFLGAIFRSTTTTSIQRDLNIVLKATALDRGQL